MVKLEKHAICVAISDEKTRLDFIKLIRKYSNTIYRDSKLPEIGTIGLAVYDITSGDWYIDNKTKRQVVNLKTLEAVGVIS